MRNYIVYFIMIFSLFSLNCPKHYAPTVKKIDVFYLGPLLDRDQNPAPVLAGAKQIEGIKVGNLVSEPPFMVILLKRSGFFDLLNDLGINFVITDTPIKSKKVFIIPKEMGYAIKNIQGIRFAIFSQGKDSLSISDRTRITLIRQRSDILWLIDKKLAELPPSHIVFLLRTREIADTNIIPLKVKPDPILQQRLQDFGQKFQTLLERKFRFKDKNFNEYLFERLAQTQDINVILYPETLFLGPGPKDSITIRQFINLVNCRIKFKKSTLTRKEIMDLINSKGLNRYGTIRKSNSALILSDLEGEYVFDLFNKTD